MGKLLAILRILWILIWIPPFLVIILFSGLIFGWKMRRALWIRRKYIKLINWGLGLKIKVLGDIDHHPGLYVSNHRSFLDPLVVLSYVDSLPIAKAEVAKYPFIGIGARMSGIVYVQRDNKDSRTSTLEAIQKWINDGYRILIYPEGTVYNGPTTGEFKTGSFIIAAQQGFKVIPMAIEYKLISDHWPYDVPTLPFSLTVLGKWKTHVTLSLGAPLQSESAVDLVDRTQSWINEQILVIRDSYDGL